MLLFAQIFGIFKKYLRNRFFQPKLAKISPRLAIFPILPRVLWCHLKIKEYRKFVII